MINFIDITSICAESQALFAKNGKTELIKLTAKNLILKLKLKSRLKQPR